MAAFLNLLDQLKNNQKAEIADMLKINSNDSRLDSQKTFVISSNTKRVLDELSELFEARNRSSVFNWLLAACFKIIRLNNEKNWKNNLQIYHNALELGNKLYTTIEETESKITNLFDKHDPPLKDLIPELNSSNPVEHFLAEIETTSITLSNSLGTLEELIQDCQKKIALAERIDRLNKSQQENI
jgi:exonuclease VII small subunit